MNNVGIVDADYYNNEDNEGHIMLGLYNTTDSDITLTKGERVAQGIFLQIPYGRWRQCRRNPQRRLWQYGREINCTLKN